MNTNVYLLPCVHESERSQDYIYIYIYIYACVCERVRMYVCMDVCVCMCVCMCVVPAILNRALALWISNCEFNLWIINRGIYIRDLLN